MGTVVKLAAARQHMKAAPATIDPAVTLWLHKALADGKEYAAIIVERVALRDAAIPAEALHEAIRASDVIVTEIRDCRFGGPKYAVLRLASLNSGRPMVG